jgi:hypothetical protein
MKRETIEQASREISLILTPPCDRWESAHQRVANVIERLLDAEREKVRKLCIKELGVLSGQWEALTTGELDNDGVAACHSAVALIRQLDLTAPSSTEEGGDAK